VAEVALVFVGFMGAGKSEAARAAAQALGTEARDADELIERELGQSIASFFEREGEAAFREREERLVCELLDGGGVISLGGGAVTSERIREALRDHVAAWCQVDPDTAWERATRNDARPLARDEASFRDLYEHRLPLYQEVARAVLPEGGRDVGAAAAPWLDALRPKPELRLAWARSKSAQYPAVVGEGALELLDGDAGAALGVERWFAVADREALAHHAGLLPATEAVIEVEAGEERKTLAEAEEVLRELARAGARRDDGLLVFGGGVVGDLAGLCAALYQRGVAVVHAPTTLVGQVDSAYGGKTGVDLPEAKNYAGAYHMPAAVLADPRTLATLPDAELAAGFVEVLKTGLIAGGDLWERVRGLDSLRRATSHVGGSEAAPDIGDAMTDVIFDCARTKLEVVAADERDGGRRAVLNLGHTVGHAIEAASGYSRYRHGEAVGLGLLATLRLSDAGELRAEVADVLDRHGLPTRLDGSISTDDVLAATELDKKRTARGVEFVLLARPGDPREGQTLDADSVRDAVDELRTQER
jgi:shikimate kinase / 3-dehydroquinate synthase